MDLVGNNIRNMELIKKDAMQRSYWKNRQQRRHDGVLNTKIFILSNLNRLIFHFIKDKDKKIL